MLSIIKAAEEELDTKYHHATALTVGQELHKFYKYGGPNPNLYGSLVRRRPFEFDTFEEYFKYFLTETCPCTLSDFYVWTYVYAAIENGIVRTIMYKTEDQYDDLLIIDEEPWFDDFRRKVKSTTFDELVYRAKTDPYEWHEVYNSDQVQQLTSWTY
jgi:hypothetical protein